ncbi:MAG: DUF4199 domain-containing protein, partial [Bacteroidia bacterium]
LALVYALLFSVAVCLVFYGNHFKYITHVYFAGLLGLFPFVYLTIWLARKDRPEGEIGGKEAAKEGFRFILVATFFLIIFQIGFFEASFREFKINYMQTVGPEALKEQMLSGQMKITEADIPKIIATDVEGVTLFKEITSVIFKNFFFGGLSVLIAAFLLKRKI